MPGRLRGRAEEIGLLEARLAAALDGDARCVLCTGESGIGKTRLAEELAARATAGGVPVAWGRAVEDAGAPPYWPWRQVLRAARGARDVLGDPTTGGRPGTPTADEGGAEARFRVFDRVSSDLSTCWES